MKKKTAAQAISEKREAVKSVLTERWAGRGFVGGAALGAGLTSFTGGGAAIGALIGGIIGALFANAAGEIPNKDNAAEFERITRDVVVKLNAFIAKHGLESSFTTFDSNSEGSRYYGVVFHEIADPDVYTHSWGGGTYGTGPEMTIFMKLDDSLMHAVRANFEQNITYESSYTYKDPNGDHGTVTGAKYSKDFDEIIAFCDDLVTRHPDMFKAVTKQKPLRPAYSD